MQLLTWSIILQLKLISIHIVCLFGLVKADALPASPTPSITQPTLPSQTTVLPYQPALTTTFIAGPSCTPSLAMLGSFDNEIWFDEPFPATNLTKSACYPPEIMTSYIEAYHASPRDDTLPHFSPLVCPLAWSVAWYGGKSESCSWSTDGCWSIACCPT